MKEAKELATGADPGINYEGGWGAQEYEYNYERRGVHKSIALGNKVHERGCTCPLCLPPGSATELAILVYC